jgi:hypothetical protein
MGKATTIQEHFVYVADDGDEAGSSLGTNDADWTQDVDTIFRVRFAVTETAGGTESQGFILRYNLAGGGYNDVGAGTPIQYASSAETTWTITDGDATTNRPLNWGSGSFTAGEYSEDAVVTGPIVLDTQWTNVEFCLTIDSAQVTDAQTFTLQVWFPGPTALDSYSATPTITINEEAAVRRIFITHV